jgi:hypothetical protein
LGYERLARGATGASERKRIIPESGNRASRSVSEAIEQTQEQVCNRYRDENFDCEMNGCFDFFHREFVFSCQSLRQLNSLLEKNGIRAFSVT